MKIFEKMPVKKKNARDKIQKMCVTGTFGFHGEKKTLFYVVVTMVTLVTKTNGSAFRKLHVYIVVTMVTLVTTTNV